MRCGGGYTALNAQRFFFSIASKRINLCEIMGFKGSASGKEPTCQCRRHKRHRFNPWFGKMPWRREYQPTLVFLPGEPHEQRNLEGYGTVQFSRSVVSDSLQPMDCSMSGFLVHHQLPELAQTHVHRVCDAIQPSHPLSSPSPPTFHHFSHQSLFQ